MEKAVELNNGADKLVGEEKMNYLSNAYLLFSVATKMKLYNNTVTMKKICEKVANMKK